MKLWHLLLESVQPRVLQRPCSEQRDQVRDTAEDGGPLVGKCHPGRPWGRMELCSTRHIHDLRLLLGPSLWGREVSTSSGFFPPCWVTFRRPLSVIFLIA